MMAAERNRDRNPWWQEVVLRLPADLLEEVEAVAELEEQTRSEIVLSALRGKSWRTKRCKEKGCALPSAQRHGGGLGYCRDHFAELYQNSRKGDRHDRN